eukprot:Pgem_evm1s6913
MQQQKLNNKITTGVIVQIIMDRGTELYNATIKQKLADIGIELRTAPKATPEMQLSELAHRTITSYSRAILKQSQLIT